MSWNLKSTSPPACFRSAQEIADLTGTHSKRVIGKILREATQIGFQLGLVWTQEHEGLFNEWVFPKLCRQFIPDNFPPIGLGLKPFQKTSSKELYKSCVKQLLGDTPLNGVTRWKRLMPAGPPSEPVWDSMYNKLISKRSGDLQWRLIHWIVPSKRLISKLFPVSTCCTFCTCSEDVPCLYQLCD